MKKQVLPVRAGSKTLKAELLEVYNLHMTAKHATDAANTAKAKLKKKMEGLQADPETGKKVLEAFRIDKDSNKIPVIATLGFDNDTVINENKVRKDLDGKTLDKVMKIQLGLLKEQVTGEQLKKFIKVVPKKSATLRIK